MHMNHQNLDDRLSWVAKRAHAQCAAVAAEAINGAAKGEATRSYQLPADDRPDGDRRCHGARVPVASEILLRRVGSFNYQVRLEEVSSAGCKVELIDMCYSGESVVARFPQLEPLGGSVRWITGKRAGVQFQSTIHPAVLDALIGRLGGAEPAQAEGTA
jgi:hypothetical protein